MSLSSFEVDGVADAVSVLAASVSAALGAAATGDFAAVVTVSTIKMSAPFATLSPTLTLICFTTPACDEGISIEALSDSTVISESSTAMVSPTLTNTSMISTESKSPISGTSTSIKLLIFFIPVTTANVARQKASCACDL